MARLVSSQVARMIVDAMQRGVIMTDLMLAHGDLILAGNGEDFDLNEYMAALAECSDLNVKNSVLQVAKQFKFPGFVNLALRCLYSVQIELQRNALVYLKDFV